MLSGNAVIVISDYEDDPSPHTLKRPAPSSATKQAPKQIRSYAATAMVEESKPTADPHVLLWIPHIGIQDHEGNDWDRLDVIGVFSSEEAAQERLEELMDERQEQFGNGHICVGDSWSDEIDLVVKPCDMFGFSTDEDEDDEDDEEDPHALLWIPHNGLEHDDGNDCYALDIRSYAAIAAAPTPKPVVAKPKKVKLKTNKEKPHVLLWIPHNGLKPSQKNNWPSLKVIGVFFTKEAAEERRTQLMNQHETYGHGDICVGGTWNDEIDLVVKPCDMFGFEGL
ncbi:hypothetical protein HDU81_002065 [Chytriomyces hyalinus]|nr:hypothetical protein HDU81_002065 [Chytriomyces hyalinus]